MRVFISWSGDRSRKVAEALRSWLPRVLQSVKPWMSQEDLNAGSRWLREVSGELETCNVGILCVTPENQHNPWLLFEAGALSKTLQDSKVCPLLHDLSPGQLSGPLTQFQAQTLNKGGVIKVLSMLNDSLESRVSEVDLVEICDVWWPKLAEQIAEIGDVPNPAEVRPIQDQLDEILELSREQLRRENVRLEAMQAREKKMDRIFGLMDHSVDMMQEIQDAAKKSEVEAQIMLSKMGEAFTTIDPNSPDSAHKILRAIGTSVGNKRRIVNLDIKAFRQLTEEMNQVDAEQKEFTNRILAQKDAPSE